MANSSSVLDGLIARDRSVLRALGVNLIADAIGKEWEFVRTRWASIAGWWEISMKIIHAGRCPTCGALLSDQKRKELLENQEQNYPNHKVNRMGWKNGPRR